MSGYGRLPVKTIAQIQVGDFRWQCKALVLDKTIVRETKNRHRLQKAIVQDSEGSTIECVLWNDRIDAFATTLQPFTTYSIRGCNVERIKEQYQYLSPGMLLEWTVTPNTVVLPITDAAERIPYPPFQSTSLADIYPIITSGSPVNILAAVIHVERPRPVPVGNTNVLLQEFMLIDQSLSPLRLTMWGEFLNDQAVELYEQRHSMPIITGRKLVGSNYEVGTLTTNLGSYITVEPDINEVQTLRTWISDSITAVRNVQQTFKDKKQTLKTATNTAAHSTSPFHSDQNAKRFVVEGKLRILDLHQQISCCYCETCHHILTAEKDEEVPCPTCQAVKKTVAGYRIAVRIESTGNPIDATLYDEQAEKLLQVSPEQIHIMSYEEVATLLEKVDESFKEKNVVAEIRTSTKRYANQRVRYTIYSWNTKDDEPVPVVPHMNQAPITVPTPEKKDHKRTYTAPTPTAVDNTTGKATSSLQQTPKSNDADPLIIAAKHESKKQKAITETKTTAAPATPPPRKVETASPQQLRNVKLEHESNK